jgi:hypothetical protein
MKQLLTRSCFSAPLTTSWMKLKILASPSFLSAIFPKKMFYQTFMKTDSALPVKLLLELQPTKDDLAVKLSCTK